MRDLYIIECRTNGALDFSGDQPEDIFGARAINGIDSDSMAKVIFRHKPDAVLDGRYIAAWPQQIDSRFIARPKTW